MLLKPGGLTPGSTVYVTVEATSKVNKTITIPTEATGKGFVSSGVFVFVSSVSWSVKKNIDGILFFCRFSQFAQVPGAQK